MANVAYDPATKTAIVQSVADARKAGKAWKLAHEAAQQAGYKGTLGGLVQLVRNNKGAVRRGPGRPAGSRNVKRRGRRPGRVATPPAATSISGTVESLVAKFVSAKVNAALDDIVAKLRAAKR